METLVPFIKDLDDAPLDNTVIILFLQNQLRQLDVKLGWYNPESETYLSSGPDGSHIHIDYGEILGWMEIGQGGIDNAYSQMRKLKPFTNEKRRRAYGKRVGDIVEYAPFGSDPQQAEVVRLTGDNNRIIVRFEDGTETDWVAEWCKILIKVEDRDDPSQLEKTLVGKTIQSVQLPQEGAQITFTDGTSFGTYADMVEVDKAGTSYNYSRNIPPIDDVALEKGAEIANQLVQENEGVYGADTSKKFLHDNKCYEIHVHAFWSPTLEYRHYKYGCFGVGNDFEKVGNQIKF